ncbi:MAG: cobyric acid synthase [Caloramator sp.]|nr:cobyric acid synthase [Caloramator sp.]
MPSIMIQGTASSAGKSIITAALCRIFCNDGLKVYPFKSQNMSLNSYITKEGLEMGRAQVLQAQAAKLEPSVLMNPILLKPTSDRKSQVIIKGKVYKNMDAVEYFNFRNKLRLMIKEIYDEIESNCDVVVIEGAGSPAEINLKENDIVNMGMAKIANSPVILVADIDKGGVFASIYGTIMLLDEEERKRIKGVIINKFRGDKSLLESGIKKIESLTNVPIIGVIPYMDLKLDEEDGAVEFNKNIEKSIDICIIKLPRMSNFTDFDAFKFDDDVSIRYISKAEDVKNADMLIIPGSKNTIEDLRWLKREGFEGVIKNFKGLVFGICGGYQMMGRSIIDEFGIEGKENDKEKALGIFNTETLIEKNKITKRVKGTALGFNIYGYEIHMGRTLKNENPFVEIVENNCSKVKYEDGDMKDNKYFGTYIHGIFDSGDFRGFILNSIRKSKGLKEKNSIDINNKREEEIEKLAKIVRENIDIEYIYSLIG